MKRDFPLLTIVSGAQTGADQGGLAAGLKLGLATSGWVSNGRPTKAGPLTDEQMMRYNLKETESSAYPERTRLNVQDADGTVWFGKTDSAGYHCTFNAAMKMRPSSSPNWHREYPWIENPDASELRSWIIANSIQTLNVAGNREHKSPGIYKLTYDTICKAIEGKF